MADIEYETMRALGQVNFPINPRDPEIILAGIRVFGLAPDQSDLRILGEAIETLKRERDSYRERIWNPPMSGPDEDREAMGWVRFADHCDVVAAHAAAHSKNVERLESRLERARRIIEGLKRTLVRAGGGSRHRELS